MEIRGRDERLYLALPPPAFRAIEVNELANAAAALGAAASDFVRGAFVDVGPVG